MSKKVPYFQEEQIERDAAALLAEFAQARGVVIAPPIPIEDIVEKHLKLGIEFDDIHRLLNHPRSGLCSSIFVWAVRQHRHSRCDHRAGSRGTGRRTASGWHQSMSKR